jgi:5'(3')-deoxyribonucleotidase
MTTTTRIGQLPVELQAYIYSFDGTIRDLYKDVVRDIGFSEWAHRRMEKEMERLDSMLEFEIQESSVWRYRIRYENREYRIWMTNQYPWEQPVIFCDGKKLVEVEWFPTANIRSLVMTHSVEDDEASKCI